MAHARSRVSVVVAVLLAVAFGLTGLPAEPAAAAPNDDEGGTSTLRDQLDAASKGFIVAQNNLAKSKKRQQELTSQLAQLERDLVAKTAVIGEVANVAYRRGRLGPITALLNSSSPEGFVDRAAGLDAVAATEDKKLRDLLDTKDEATRAKLAIDKEIVEQQKQVQIMAARKKQAENALKAAGAGQSTGGPSGGSSSGGGSSGTAARFGGGSGCVDDPTTSGCISPRLLHALNEAKKAGFTRFVSCFRSGSSGEHPKGRACDFAAQRDGFGGAATGGDRTYGNNLTNFFVRNASRLGVLYVIWYREIWLPSSGWKAYSGSGSPSAEHTNHVHLSVT